MKIPTVSSFSPSIKITLLKSVYSFREWTTNFRFQDLFFLVHNKLHHHFLVLLSVAIHCTCLSQPGQLILSDSLSASPNPAVISWQQITRQNPMTQVLSIDFSQLALRRFKYRDSIQWLNALYLQDSQLRIETLGDLLKHFGNLFQVLDSFTCDSSGGDSNELREIVLEQKTEFLSYIERSSLSLVQLRRRDQNDFRISPRRYRSVNEL
jgi:hypothetical protein